MMVPEETATTHYAEHEGKPFYPGLIKFITSSPVVVLAIRGVEAISVCRTLIGATNGRKAEPGSIRGDFGMSGGFNMIHGSDSAVVCVGCGRRAERAVAQAQWESGSAVPT